MTSTATPAALLPCPLCGGPITLEHSKTLGDRLFVIACEKTSPCFGSGLGNYVIAGQRDEAIAAWNRRPSPPPSGDVEARLRAVAEALKDDRPNAASVALEALETLTQERELRKAAEGERDEALRTATMLVKKGNEDVELMRATASTISSLKARAEAAEAQLAQLRKDAVEVVKPFAEAADNLDPKDRGDIWESGAAMSINAADLRAARIFLNANDQGTNDGR